GCPEPIRCRPWRHSQAHRRLCRRAAQARLSGQGGHGARRMTEHSPPWPKQGPASYFPSIEKKHGRSIAEWQQVIATCGLDKHMAIVGYLKSEHGMGHG